MIIKASYYQQFDADFSLDVPGESYGGWKETETEISAQHTALVVMHAWNIRTIEEFPGWHGRHGPAGVHLLRLEGRSDGGGERRDGPIMRLVPSESSAKVNGDEVRLQYAERRVSDSSPW